MSATRVASMKCIHLKVYLRTALPADGVQSVVTRAQVIALFPILVNNLAHVISLAVVITQICV